MAREASPRIHGQENRLEVGNNLVVCIVERIGPLHAAAARHAPISRSSRIGDPEGTGIVARASSREYLVYRSQIHLPYYMHMGILIMQYGGGGGIRYGNGHRKTGGQDRAVEKFVHGLRNGEIVGDPAAERRMRHATREGNRPSLGLT
eukprot:5451448-Pleurochrysis_carterae.AAC.1